VSFDPSLPEEGANVSPTHPLREAALLVGGLVGVAVLLALALALLVDLLVPHLPPRLESRLFGGGWAAFGVDPEHSGGRSAELQRLVDRLARHWPENPYVLRAGLWEQEEPNAFALPGGWIVVTSGLLDGIDSENELAFVVGHELGHFEHRDHLRGLGRGAAFGLLLVGLGVSGAGTAGDLAGLAGRLAQRGFDRDQERRADAFGLALVAAEYGHVAGASEFFDQAPRSGDGLGERLEAYFSTHPLHEDRVAALGALAAERGWPTRGALTALPD
jgi:Zn-dependent protease with chaperone function